ncbi:hypothetical protein R3P38DRAFT_953319 [Favolaschia claudopus]|uniref:F-box domain-containing protein n=1 Tax=Favolaschia claudopus TaxID=2862362 RepID=A0AAW0BNK0_9AGAR
MSLSPNIASIGFTSPSLPSSAQLKTLRDLTRSCALPADPGALQATITAATSEIGRYDIEIEKIQEELDRLVSERDLLSSYANGCRSVLSAPYRLPDDVLVEIFDWCFPEDLYVMSSKTTGQQELDRITHRYILDLAHVCSRWYHVAMATPRLWSMFVVDVECWRRSRATASTLLALLESALDRGKNYPLDLTLRVGSYHNRADAALELFFKHAHRWRELELYSMGHPPECISAATGSLSLDCLEKLFFRAMRKNDNSWEDVEIFQRAPRLTSLEFKGFPASLPKLPWAQINTCTHFSSRDYDCRYQPLTILRNAATHSLYKLVLDLRDRSLATESWDLIEISSEVQNLQIWFSTYNSVVTGKFFDSLTLPRVQTLAFHVAHDFPCPVWACNSFLALAERSVFHDSLFTLRLHQVRVTDTDLLRCLEVLPRLMCLEICDCPTEGVVVITDKLLQGLIYNSDLSALVPRLEYLQLTSLFEFSEEAYLDLVVSRVDLEKHCHDVGNREAFETKLFLRDASDRKLSPPVLQKFSELESQNKLVFTLGRWR